MKPHFLIGCTTLVCLSVYLLLHTNSHKPVSKHLPYISLSATDTGLTKIVKLAEAFKETLNKDQVATVQLEYTKANAQKWSNFPQAFTNPKRVGISMGSLNETQKAVAKALLVCVLSTSKTNEGYDELLGIFAADNYYGTTTGKTDVFNEGNFYLAFLGTPSTSSLWELQFGGHHVAIANTYNNGKLIGVTPSFRGAEPTGTITVGKRKYEPLQNEKELFAKLIQSLIEEQKAIAKLTATFSDMLLGRGKDNRFPQTAQGVQAKSLSATQQKLLLQVIEVYVKDLDDVTATQLMAKYKSGLAETYIAYSGSGTMNELNDYARIDGPAIWIEYSAQPSRSFPELKQHPHTVWRDKKTDYGGN